MKAYCINLDRRPDRLEHMTRQFAALGLPFERIPAVDARDPAVADAALCCGISMTGVRMSAGAFACFQSHRKAWRRLMASGDSHAMIFEDDLVLAEGIAGYLDPAWVPADADLVRLETFLSRFHRDRGAGIAVAGRHIHRLRSRHVGTGGYVVAARTASRLLAASEVPADPIDEWLFNDKSSLFASLATYQMIPAPVIQGDRLVQVEPEDGPNWSASSISERFAVDEVGGANQPKITVETSAARLQRRLREEWRGFAAGTAYVVAPFG